MATKQTELMELGRINAEPVKNSGRGHFHKGDGIIGPDNFATVDVKESNKSFGLSRSAAAKLNKDAQQNKSKYGMFFVSLGEQEPKMRYAVIPEQMFNEMIEAYEQQYG